MEEERKSWKLDIFELFLFSMHKKVLQCIFQELVHEVAAGEEEGIKERTETGKARNRHSKILIILFFC